ncbi:MAG: NAC domain-containing protein, partial [Candidatus Bathyarchaeia archaeon]
MRKISPREARRLMQRMGLNMTNLNVTEVVLKTEDKEIIIENPEVTVLDLQGQKIFQVAGGKISERSVKRK